MRRFQMRSLPLSLPRRTPRIRQPMAVVDWTDRVVRTQARLATKPDVISAVSKDIADTIQRSLTDPAFAAVFVVALVLLFSHAGDIDVGPLKDLFPKSSTNAFVVWVRANVGKFFGIVVFVPAVYSVPPLHRALVALVALTWIVVVPESSQNEYIAQAVLLALYFRVRAKATRVAVVAVGAALYFGGYLFTAKTATASSAKNSSG